MSTAMNRYFFSSCVVFCLVLIAGNLAGCAYTRAMAKAEADRSRIKTEMRLADAGQQSERSRTAALEEEHGQIRQEIDALNRTMASLQRRLSALAVVPVRRRSSGQKVQIDQLKSEIARTQQRMNEKKERYRYLSVRL